MQKHQLIRNEELDTDFDFLSIAPQVAEILEVDECFVGTFFRGEQSTIFQSDDLETIREKQLLLENLGIYCDIKTTEIDAEPEATQAVTEAPPAVEAIAEAPSEPAEKSNITIDDLISDLALTDPALYDSKTQDPETPKLNPIELELEEFDPNFDKFKN